MDKIVCPGGLQLVGHTCVQVTRLQSWLMDPREEGTDYGQSRAGACVQVFSFGSVYLAPLVGQVLF